jgi:hypothetical protein
VPPKVAITTFPLPFLSALKAFPGVPGAKRCSSWRFHDLVKLPALSGARGALALALSLARSLALAASRRRRSR